jgi:hypothetical protein
VGRGAFAPLIMTAIVKRQNSIDLARLVTEAERFVFLVSSLCQRRSNTGDSEFYRLAGALYRDESTPDQAIQMVNGRTHEHFRWPRAQFIISQLFDENRGGFYGWKGRYHFLFEYELYLKARSGASAFKINWSHFIQSKKDFVSIEHIYPQSPNIGEWPTFETLAVVERRYLMNSLGNLLALAGKKNSSLQNWKFKDKVRKSDGTAGYFNGSYSEIEVSQETDWTPNDVLERGLRLLEFMELRWDVKFPDRASKLNFLHLGFMDPATAV